MVQKEVECQTVRQEVEKLQTVVTRLDSDRDILRDQLWQSQAAIKVTSLSPVKISRNLKK